MRQFLLEFLPKPIINRLRPIVAKWRLSQNPIQIDELPHLGPEAQIAFLDHVRRASVYLEYGSGGSTVAAARLAKQVISVDSDAAFLKAVARKAKSGSAKLLPVHVPIGPTGMWGFPVDRNATPEQVRIWKHYPTAPWRLLESLGETPDLILIDGRFRVACALESLLRLPPGSECTILFDDYVTRPYYHVVESFVRDIVAFDRLISCKKSRDFDIDRCRSLRDEHFADPQ